MNRLLTKEIIAGLCDKCHIPVSLAAATA